MHESEPILKILRPDLSEAALEHISELLPDVPLSHTELGRLAESLQPLGARAIPVKLDSITVGVDLVIPDCVSEMRVSKILSAFRSRGWVDGYFGNALPVGGEWSFRFSLAGAGPFGRWVSADLPAMRTAFADLAGALRPLEVDVVQLDA